MDPPQGVSTCLRFRANGMYDPDISGVGHQPYGFDQLMAMYRRYEVLSSRIQVEIHTSSINTGIPIVAFISCMDPSRTLEGVVPELLMERNDVKSKTIQNGAGHPGVTKLSETYSVKKFFGNAFRNGDDTLQGTASADPTRHVDYVVGAAPWVSSSNPAAVQMLVRISYRCRFNTPLELSAS